ncbi:MAG: hypothetical protein E6G01_15775 [Actinobacteria bacterium]|nr:MAG: hypothetical protein E6G01_15775 [Actinomycetota bacterium]
MEPRANGREKSEQRAPFGDHTLPRTIRILSDQAELEEALRRAATHDQALADQISRRAARYLR